MSVFHNKAVKADYQDTTTLRTLVYFYKVARSGADGCVRLCGHVTSLNGFSV